MSHKFIVGKTGSEAHCRACGCVYADGLHQGSPSRTVPEESLLTGDVDFDTTLKSCLSILGVKGRDYTVGSPDRLANFNRAGELLGMRPEQVLAVYWYKHVAAVLSYIKTGGQSESEPIEGRIADVINYMLLLGKMIAEKKRNPMYPGGVRSASTVDTTPPAPRAFEVEYHGATCHKCKREPVEVNSEVLCLTCFSDVSK